MQNAEISLCYTFVDNPTPQMQHATGRRLICSVLGCREEDIRIAPDGKPFLPNSPHFNISHSGGMVLLAVCEESPVGCDVEPANRTAKNEAAIRAKLFPGEDDVPFLQLWTAYEARLKSGLGEVAEVLFCDVHADFIVAVAAHVGAAICRPQ